MAAIISVPQNAPILRTDPDGSVRMSRPWVMFFQQLQKLSQEAVRNIQSGLTPDFLILDPQGNIQASGYDQTNFLQLADLTPMDITTAVLTSLAGGAPNLLVKTRTAHIVDGILAALGDESAAVAVKPKAYKDIQLNLRADAGGASIPALVAWNAGTIYVYAFEGATTVKQLFGCLEYGHELREGADIVPHIHWAPSTTGAGNVKWNLTYVWDNDGEGPSAPATISATTAASGTAWRLQRSDFPAISGAGKLIGSQLQFRLWRDPTDAADTYADQSAIQTFGVHAEVDSFGSTTPTAK